MQKRQPILQPAWLLTHRVRRSSSGIITASTAERSVWPEAASHSTGNRYFTVPSVDSALPTGAAVPRAYFSFNAAFAALEILPIASQELTFFP